MNIKKAVCLLLATLLVLSAAACGKADPADTDAVRAALDKFRNCESFTAVQLSRQQERIVEEGTEYEYGLVNEVEMNVITAPSFQLETTTTSSIEFDGELSSQTITSYILPENGGYTEYFNNGTEWYKLSTQDADIMSGIGADAIIKSFFVDSVDFRRVGEEERNGLKAARYEGRLEGEELVKLLESSGYLGSIASMSENQQSQIKKLFAKELKAVTVLVWLDEGSGYPVGFEVNMAQVLKALGESVAKSTGSGESQLNISEYVISMSLKNFNAVGDIVLPAEAATAQVYEVPEQG